ncbi:unnamed protein product [Acanthosepion pharaonis]|uniref:Uncharacterized protein n=1 Tax=Acanthosepion pharaonis TaxID=158019 RepID=A0A812CF15_ACAPH|nr:unnamed protein product [Sepia pharaonis]
MESEEKIEDTSGAYVESPIKLEAFIEILAKIALLLLLVCIGLLLVIFRIIYGISLILLQVMVAIITVVIGALNVPIRMFSSTATVLVTSFLSPVETVTVVLKVACVSVIVSFGFVVEIVRLTLRNFLHIINAFVLIVRHLIGLAFVLMGVVMAAVAVSLTNFVVCTMLITRLFLFAMIIALISYWIEPLPDDDIWTNIVSILPPKLLLWIL